MTYVLITLSILLNGFVAGMFLIFAVAGMSQVEGSRFAERLLVVEIAALLGLYAGALALGYYEHPWWGGLLPCASVPLLFATMEMKRRHFWRSRG